MALADQAAVAAGITVVASSGDSGPFNNIGSPATTPGVIAVGGTTTYRVYRQTTRYGTQLSPGGWENSNITALSSDGFTQFNPSTVDVVAPGDRGWSLCSSDTTQFTGCADIDHGANPPPIWAAGGTSASAPETSGTAALVISAYEKTHNGHAPSPELVKQIIVSTAQDLGAPADQQGAGLVDTLKAVQLAETINGGSQPQGNSLFVRQTSLSATVERRPDVTLQRQRHQRGHEPADGDAVAHRDRTQPTSNDTGTVTLDASSPTFVDGEGNTDSYEEHTFTVPAGADYLTGDITWAALPPIPPAPAAVYETLFNPQGQVAAYSLLGNQPERVRARRGAPAGGRHVDGGDLHRQQRRPAYNGDGPVRLRDRAVPERRRGVPVVPDAAARAVGELPGAGARRAGRGRELPAAPRHGLEHATGASRSSSGRWCRSRGRAARSPGKLTGGADAGSAVRRSPISSGCRGAGRR